MKIPWPSFPNWIFCMCAYFTLFFTVSGDGEIANMAKFFRDHNMYLHVKTKFRSSNLVENSIRTIKRTLYYILRRKKSKNWAKYLSSAVNTGISRKLQMMQTRKIVLQFSNLQLARSRTYTEVDQKKSKNTSTICKFAICGVFLYSESQL